MVQTPMTGYERWNSSETVQVAISESKSDARGRGLFSLKNP
jgi:hypothetical protein